MDPEERQLPARLTEQLREQINNMAAAIQLLAPVVREQGGPQYNPYLAILYQSLYRMMHMLGNLEYLDLPEHETPLRETTLDLAGLCRELARQVTPLARQAGVEFTYEEETGSLITRGDSGLLRRMLLGLISNALRAAGNGGQAGLRLAVHSGRAAMTVWDNGPGLGGGEEEESLLRHVDGLGLGLRVARRIAARHGGAIVFEQREGRGSRAIASLPIRTEGGDGVFRSPRMGYESGGGFSDLLVELSGVLPFEAFLPDQLE